MDLGSDRNFSAGAAVQKFVSIVSTGSELVSGETLNTTATSIARALSKKNIQVRQYWTVSDDEEDILFALSTLLNTSESIILTGGLGPTSDDRTRFVLSKFLGKDLVFNAGSWQKIVERLQLFGLQAHESNRQQALFPEGSTPLPNPNGSAEGCKIQVGEKFIFMLPGPPHECLPMLDAGVLPCLIEGGFSKSYTQYSWKLLGAVEGEIGAQVDAIARLKNVETAYCWRYPYLEVTLRIKGEETRSWVQEVRKVLKPYIVSENDERGRTASQLLVDWLLEQSSHSAAPSLDHSTGIKWQIRDLVTGGSLERKLRIPSTLHKIQFLHDGEFEPASNTLQILVSGLVEYWKGQEGTTALSKKGQLKVSISDSVRSVSSTTSIPLRGDEVREYAAEYVAWEVLKFLSPTT